MASAPWTLHFDAVAMCPWVIHENFNHSLLRDSATQHGNSFSRTETSMLRGSAIPMVVMIMPSCPFLKTFDSWTVLDSILPLHGIWQRYHPHTPRNQDENPEWVARVDVAQQTWLSMSVSYCKEGCCVFNSGVLRIVSRLPTWSRWLLAKHLSGSWKGTNWNPLCAWFEVRIYSAFTYLFCSYFSAVSAHLVFCWPIFVNDSVNPRLELFVWIIQTCEPKLAIRKHNQTIKRFEFCQDWHLQISKPDNCRPQAAPRLQPKGILICLPVWPSTIEEVGPTSVIYIFRSKYLWVVQENVEEICMSLVK